MMATASPALGLWMGIPAKVSLAGANKPLDRIDKQLDWATQKLKYAQFRIHNR